MLPSRYYSAWSEDISPGSHVKAAVAACRCCSVARSCPILWKPMDCSTPGFCVLHCLLELAPIRVHWVAIQPSHSLSSPSPPAFNLSQIQGLFHESVLCIRWPKYWSFSLSISPSSEYPGMVCFRVAWFDLLVVQGTLKNLLQHHNLKISILWQLAFFLVQYPVHDHWRNHSFD